MDASPEPEPKSVLRTTARAGGKAARWRLPRWPVLVGMVGVGAAVTTGTLVKRRADARQGAEIQAIRMEVNASKSELAVYRSRMVSLQAEAEQMRAAAESSRVEPAKSWTRARARCFDAFVERVNRRADEAAFDEQSKAIEAACARGDVPAARGGLLQLTAVSFPSTAKFAALKAEAYLQPLAEFSRQTPDYYRAFQQHEPEAAREDFAALRKELAGAEIEATTPQLMLKMELFSTVAPKDDPLLEDIAALASAADFFENPDPATLAAWRRAQRAIRIAEWPTAAAEMQSILRTTVRTRQPFRAAYGRAILQNKPDDPDAAYPYLEEAAGAGDAAARAWVVQQDLAQGRTAQALRWLEVGALAGDKDNTAKLLELYARPRTAVPRDPTRETGVLLRLVAAPDAPPLVSMLLARHYEEGGGLPTSPTKAFACYREAAEKKHVPAFAEVARRYLQGDGTAVDLDQARDWACRAFAAGEQEAALPLLIELMATAPERTAPAVQQMFEQEQVAGAAGFDDTRIGGPSMAQLQLQLARFFDQSGNYAQAAKFYEKSGSRDAAVVKRRGELTTVRPCETCGGLGKVKQSPPCPTCEGKGTVLCPLCDGRGYSFAPGSPPCSTCGGSGQVRQDGRVFACSTCGGTGKAKSSVIKQPCPNCAQGRAACRECGGTGRRTVLKECPDCHGAGARALADK